MTNGNDSCEAQPNSMGLDQVPRVWQDAYDRYVAAQQ